MASLSTQIKAKIQQIGSPKIQVGTTKQVTTGAGLSIGQNLKPQMQKPLNRVDGGNNQSQSPDDQGTGRGVLQRIQMKNLAFIPAKGQSPIHSTMSQSNLSHNYQGSPQDTTNGTNILQKISPQRIIGLGNKVVIPANQIKLIKKDGTSPSPEARHPQLKQLSPTSVNFAMQSNLQNKNPNQLNLRQQQPLNINNQNKSSKNLLALIQQTSSSNLSHQSEKQHGNFTNTHMSDDETNVNSDNEDNHPQTQRTSQALGQNKNDQSNFNRPKINTMQQQQHSSNATHNSTFTDQTLNSQRTQRGQIQGTSSNLQDQNKVKIISQKQIRHSPSPPPNQILKNNNQPPVVTNMQNQMKNQQSHQQLQQNNQQQHHYTHQNKPPTHHQSSNHNQQQHTITQNQSQQQLASDFIKGMINQSKTNTSLNQQTAQKKVLGSGLQSVIKKNMQMNQQQQQQQFQKDMKKHGIAKDIQEVSQFAPVISESSPPRIEDNKMTVTANMTGQQKLIPQKQQVTKISHIRNYSPPPNFDQAGLTALNDMSKQALNQTKPSDNSPTNTTTNISTQQEEQNTTTQGGEQSGYQFPFQRRARSLSLPKQEMIQNKMQQKNGGMQPTNTNTSGIQQQDLDKTSQSPHRPQDQQQDARKGNKPVVAKINFVIQKGGVVQKEDESAVFERNKEVDEWLMGSGESHATAASNTKVLNNNFVGNKQSNSKHVHGKKSLTEFDKPIQPAIKDEDEDSVEQEEEDWMFRTFDKVKKGQQQQQIPPTINNNVLQSRRLESNRDVNLEEAFEDPFEMAPEMQKQFMKSKPQDLDPFMCDMDSDFGQSVPIMKGGKINNNNNNNLNDGCNFMDQIDQFVESGFL